MSQTKIMDFCGSGELLSTMLGDVHFCEALSSEMAGRKVTMVVFVEDEEELLPETCGPKPTPGDQIAYNDGDGWKYTTIARGCIAGAEIRHVEKNGWNWTEVSYSGTVKKPEKETLQGNDLSMNVEDDLKFGVFEKQTNEPEFQWRKTEDDEWQDCIGGVLPSSVGEVFVRIKTPVKQWGGESMESLNGRNEPEYQPKFGPSADGWITWNGGIRPVPGNCIVSVKWNDGSEDHNCEAKTWRWDCEDRAVNIIAYKIVDQFSAERGDDEESQL